MITVTVINAHPTRRLRVAVTRSLVRQVLRGEKIRRGDVTVVGSTSRASRKLNRQFLAHDFVTDVIAFTLEHRPYLEGEIYLNLDRARKQAREYGVSVSNEIARLTVHGALHLAGYDDRTGRAAARMHRVQERYLMRGAGKNGK